MTQKWNLQDIRPAEPRRRRPAIEDESTTLISARQPRPTSSESGAPYTPREEHRQDYDTETIVIKNGNKEGRLKVILLSSALAVIIIGIFALSATLSKTTLTVYPELYEPTVNAEFIAYPDRRAGELAYEIMTLSTEGERQVKATGQETVSEQAKGVIQIVKSTPGTERLIKNTRFRTPTGLIFRIQESVVVPGAITDSTGKSVPGTIQAEVFAENPGQEYNVAAGTRFDVPGFQESNLPALYNAIYAQNLEPITGGFNGPKFIIDEAELATAKQSLQIELRDKLLERAKTEQPAGFVAFPGSIAITYNSMPTIQFGENLVTIREVATLQLPLFKSEDFATYIAEKTIPSYMQEMVRITNVTDLTFAYTDTNMSASNIANATALNFSILGKPQIVTTYNADTLKSDLAGKSLTAISVVLTGHPGIKKAEISGKPFWKRSFPEETGDIDVIEVIETK